VASPTLFSTANSYARALHTELFLLLAVSWPHFTRFLINPPFFPRMTQALQQYNLPSSSLQPINTNNFEMSLLITPRVFPIIAYLILTASAQVSPITTMSGYQSARACVQSCLLNNVWGYGYAWNVIGCMQQNPVSCQCGTVGGASLSISAYLSGCASSSCGDAAEASSAVSIFHDYCTVNLTPLGSQPTDGGTSTGM
jgi:hypothetical protein